MRMLRRAGGSARAALAAGALGLVLVPGSATAADPVIQGGIGLTSCAEIAARLKPAEGLANPTNAQLFAWVQGYISAANVHLLNENNMHVDLNIADEGKVLKLVQDYCIANPGQEPLTVIDTFIREARKIKVKEDDVFDPWEL
jgi:hypothetical protein